MPGKSFQSKLEPHFDLILEARRKRQTWEAIVQLLADPWNHHDPTSGLLVYETTIEATLSARDGSGGSKPVTVTPPSPERSDRPELPQLTEPQSEFGADPLTLPPKGKNKSKSPWTVH